MTLEVPPWWEHVQGSLRMAVFTPEEGGFLRSLAPLPPSLRWLSPPGEEGLGAERFPFLQEFLQEAARVWSGAEEGPLRSGVWMETGPEGGTVALEAVALRGEGLSLLLIEEGGQRFRERVAILQAARDGEWAHQRLRREVEIRDVLLHCVVHDLRGPLTAILGALQLLQMQGTSPQQEELLALGERQAEKLGERISSLLQVFRAEVEALEAFSSDPRTAPDLGEAVEEVLSSLSPSGRSRGVGLMREGEGFPPLRVVGEKDRLVRILTNLVENALRHAPQGSVVTVGVDRVEGGFCCRVEDRGAGVPEGDIPFLFERFHQGGPGARRGKVGLGLYFCRTTVQRWGGEMGYRQREGGGACFWFRLVGVG